MKEIEVFTDGACRGNPGPGGWGALLRYGGHEKELYGGEAMTTNLPAPGTDINTAEGEVAGQLVQACPIDNNHSLVQLTLKLSAATQTLFLSDGIEISSVLPLGGD